MSNCISRIVSKLAATAPLVLLSFVIGCGGGGGKSGSTGTTASTATTSGSVQFIPVAATSISSRMTAAAINGTTSREYVTYHDADQLAVLDVPAFTVLATIPMTTVNPLNQPGPLGVAVNEATNRVYVANEGGDTIAVVDGVTNAVTASIDTSSMGNPVGIGVNSTTNQFFAAIFHNGFAQIAVYDGATNTLVKTIFVNAPGLLSITGAPASVQVNAATNKVFVAYNLDSNLLVVDPVAGTCKTIAQTDPIGAVFTNPDNASLGVLVSKFANRTATTTDTLTIYSSPDGLPRSRTSSGPVTIKLPEGFKAYAANFFPAGAGVDGGAFVVGRLNDATGLEYVLIAADGRILFSTHVAEGPGDWQAMLRYQERLLLQRWNIDLTKLKSEYIEYKK